MAKPAVADQILALLARRDGLTSQQIYAEIINERPSLTKGTLHPCLSRLGKERRLFCYLGVWSLWPECARVD